MSLFHRHQWTDWQTKQAFIGEYIFGGGQAMVVIQQRQCRKCHKIELNRQVG